MRSSADIATRVRSFYETHPFPAFDASKFASIDDFRARASPYVVLLDQQVPYAARLADIGCGTGQLAAYLALRPGRSVTAIDLSAGSLRYARGLRARFALANLRLVQGDALALPVPGSSFDHVFCNGVLHHTADPRRGLGELARIVRPGGYVVIGLYNRYGRVAHGGVRWLSRHTPIGRRLAERGLRRMLGSQFEEDDAEKRRTWWADQFAHPYESVHSASEVLRWFDETGLDYAASLPPLELGRDGSHANLFPRRLPRRPMALAVLAQQLLWLWRLRWTGGYFILVGRKREA